MKGPTRVSESPYRDSPVNERKMLRKGDPVHVLGPPQEYINVKVMYLTTLNERGFRTLRKPTLEEVENAGLERP